MGRFVASLLMSVDGFEANDLFAPTDEEHQIFNDQLAQAGAVIFDRENYDLLVPYWDEVDVTDGALPPVERRFAELFRTRPRYVVAGALGQPDRLATLIEGDPVGQLRRLKTEEGGDLMVAAGPALCAALLDGGLIDELEILMLPVVVGTGSRQIGDLAQTQPLELIGARSLASGAVALRYRVTSSAS